MGVVLAAAGVGAAREGRDVDSRVLGAAATQNLDGVKVPLSVKLGKLEEKEEKTH